MKKPIEIVEPTEEERRRIFSDPPPNEEDRAFGQPHRGHADFHAPEGFGKDRIDSGEPLLQFFAYQHLPGHLQAISVLFCDLAEHLVQRLPRNPERTVALRKLLESKDCAVRAALWKP